MDATTAERAERYRSLADTSRGLAERASDPDVRASYAELAAAWMRLADRVSCETRSFDVGDGASSTAMDA